MRERRWESRAKLEFGDVLAIGERLAGLGLEPAVPARDTSEYDSIGEDLYSKGRS